MTFMAKILSWHFRHLNIVCCLLKRRPTKGGGGGLTKCLSKFSTLSLPVDDVFTARTHQVPIIEAIHSTILGAHPWFFWKINSYSYSWLSTVLCWTFWFGNAPQLAVQMYSCLLLAISNHKSLVNSDISLRTLLLPNTTSVLSCWSHTFAFHSHHLTVTSVFKRG